MRHRKFTFKIGRSGAHRKAMLGNMVCSLLREQRITTTLTKAKQARRLAEKMITLGKRGSDHDRRRAAAVLRQPDVVDMLFTEIAPRFQERQGGYTRMMKLGPRVGDGAEMCILELVSEPVVPKQQEGAQPATAAVDSPSEDKDKSATDTEVESDSAENSGEENTVKATAEDTAEPDQKATEATEKGAEKEV